MTISPAVSGEKRHKHEHGSHKHEHSSHKHDSHKHNKKHSGHKHEKGHDDHDHKKGHGAHEHGVSQLNVGVSGSKVEIELASPGVDIVGFEHKPSTAEQKERVKKALAKLREPGTLVELPKEAKCKRTEAEAHLEQESKEHAEFEVHLHFTCDNPSALDHIDITAFSTFPGIREINAQAITPNGQFAAELTSKRDHLTLK
tara:strand:- start:130 stop:729 length:600 start_codon:yes stop_codon:yes gene_type:complete